MYDVLVIGAGQAGLAMGYYLKQANVSFILLDQGREIGETWRKRYDSLTLFTPRMYSSLPGLSLKGEPNQYPTKDEISDYLDRYAKEFSLPVKLNTSVNKLEKEKEGFVLSTNHGEYRSKNVIVATGPFQNPFIPAFSKHLSKDVLQLHSSQYKNPAQLLNGPTLVVGGGSSGAQIAVELSGDRDVYLSVGHTPTFLPQDIGNKSIFWWFDKLGILKANVHSRLGQIIKNRPDPIFGFELKTQLRKGRIQQKPRAISAQKDAILFEDHTEAVVKNVIWSTGFKVDYSWISIPSLVDEKGLPKHSRGVSPVEGLYFLGLRWQYRRGSALLQGVGSDASYLASKIVNGR